MSHYVCNTNFCGSFDGFAALASRIPFQLVIGSSGGFIPNGLAFPSGIGDFIKTRHLLHRKYRNVLPSDETWLDDNNTPYSIDILYCHASRFLCCCTSYNHKQESELRFHCDSIEMLKGFSDTTPVTWKHKSKGDYSHFNGRMLAIQDFVFKVRGSQYSDYLINKVSPPFLNGFPFDEMAWLNASRCPFEFINKLIVLNDSYHMRFLQDRMPFMDLKCFHSKRVQHGLPRTVIAVCSNERFMLRSGVVHSMFAIMPHQLLRGSNEWARDSIGYNRYRFPELRTFFREGGITPEVILDFDLGGFILEMCNRDIDSNPDFSSRHSSRTDLNNDDIHGDDLPNVEFNIRDHILKDRESVWRSYILNTANGSINRCLLRFRSTISDVSRDLKMLSGHTFYAGLLMAGPPPNADLGDKGLDPVGVGLSYIKILLDANLIDHSLCNEVRQEAMVRRVMPDISSETPVDDVSMMVGLIMLCELLHDMPSYWISCTSMDNCSVISRGSGFYHSREDVIDQLSSMFSHRVTKKIMEYVNKIWKFLMKGVNTMMGSIFELEGRNNFREFLDHVTGLENKMISSDGSRVGDADTFLLNEGYGLDGTLYDFRTSNNFCCSSFDSVPNIIGYTEKLICSDSNKNAAGGTANVSAILILLLLERCRSSYMDGLNYDVSDMGHHDLRINSILLCFFPYEYIRHVMDHDVVFRLRYDSTARSYHYLKPLISLFIEIWGSSYFSYVNSDDNGSSFNLNVSPSLFHNDLISCFSHMSESSIDDFHPLNTSVFSGLLVHPRLTVRDQSETSPDVVNDDSVHDVVDDNPVSANSTYEVPDLEFDIINKALKGSVRGGITTESITRSSYVGDVDFIPRSDAPYCLTEEIKTNSANPLVCSGYTRKSTINIKYSRDHEETEAEERVRGEDSFRRQKIIDRSFTGTRILDIRIIDASLSSNVHTVHESDLGTWTSFRHQCILLSNIIPI